MKQHIGITIQAIASRERVTYYLLPELVEVATEFVARGQGQKIARAMGFVEMKKDLIELCPLIDG